MAADPTFFLVGKLSGGPDAHIIELSGYLSAYSPYIFYGEERQRLVSPFIRVDEAAALEALVFLGEFRADFRQCLRFCNAYGYRGFQQPEVHLPIFWSHSDRAGYRAFLTARLLLFY